MEDCKAFLDWCACAGDKAAVAFLEELCDMQWTGKRQNERIDIAGIHQHNACNHTLNGNFTHDGVTYGFVIDNGDWAGTVVREFGPAEDVGGYEPPRPTLYTFIPRDRMLPFDKPGIWQAYLYWREKPWFKDKAHGYNYDRHFAPGGKTESYYRDWAATKGMVIASEEAFQELLTFAAGPAPISADELLKAWNSPQSPALEAGSEDAANG